MNVAALENAARDIGRIGRAAPQPLDRRILVPECGQKGVGKFARVKWRARERRYRFFDLNGVHISRLPTHHRPPERGSNKLPLRSSLNSATPVHAASPIAGDGHERGARPGASRRGSSGAVGYRLPPRLSRTDAHGTLGKTRIAVVPVIIVNARAPGFLRCGRHLVRWDSTRSARSLRLVYVGRWFHRTSASLRRFHVQGSGSAL